jgi:GAF domain-containing protein
MAHDSLIHVLAAVPVAARPRYQENLGAEFQLRLTVVTSEDDARALLADPQQHTGVLVVDSGLGDVYELVRSLRQSFPRLLIVVVDEGADFSLPGQADEVSVEPFENDDLIRRIKRLAQERSLETLRADALPPVRAFAKSLRRAGPGQARQQAAVEAIQELGYDYVAFYSMLPADPPSLKLGAQIGPEDLTGSAPQQQDAHTSLVGWVTQNGQSRIVASRDEPNHPFIRQGRFQAGVCVPVGTTMRFGAILACRQQANSITQQNVMMLELVSAQLAHALARQARS